MQGVAVLSATLYNGWELAPIEMAVYLNTYEVHQAYGGPEEGGWWYDCGTPVQSILLSSEEYEVWVESQEGSSINELREKATIAFTNGKSPTPRSNGYGGYVFAPGSDDPLAFEMDNSFVSVIEEKFAEAYPQERPYYC